MEIIYSEIAQEDILYWRKSGNKGIQKKIQSLIEDIKKTPFEGIGKPHALKHNLSGSWSRRINDEHRIVYAVDGDFIKIDSLRGHYE
ncbi:MULTISPECIES: Txe/YoeB family addiction module toxin [unclassified Flavobacterium]|jgi:toxin YoeB|uniref:Txe/YoeB family addiction module toxin n=1 Tax=unclassified Flavobacterium TaxID=196869 RepID=UPI00131C15DC|nr:MULTISPECIES: Txe/YoeB family addiction module toxin [unclassified Flavobacterium]